MAGRKSFGRAIRHAGTSGVVLAVIAAMTWPGGCGPQGDDGTGVEDLPPPPETIQSTARAQAEDLEQPLDAWSQDLLKGLLEGTTVEPGTAVEGEAAPLAGRWTSTLVDSTTGQSDKTQITFNQAGAAVELRLFSDELVEAAVIAVGPSDAGAKATATGRWLGSRVAVREGAVFEVIIVVAIDTVEGEAIVRTREVFQLTVSFRADGTVLAGAARRTREVIASTEAALPPGTVLVSAGTAELVRDEAPVARAGEDQTVAPSAEGTAAVTLDGSSSTDPDGTITAFVWTEGELEIATGRTASVELAAGVHQITLTVTDDGGSQASDTIVVTVQEGDGGASGKILRVDRTTPVDGDGSAWDQAIPRLQDALAIAAESGGAVTEIWVADGIYHPADAGGDRAATFQLVNGVAVYGGFQGGETKRDQRDPVQFISVLSGDLAGDDSADVGGPAQAENSFHVVTGPTTALGEGDSPAVLDGFRIIGGNANGELPHDTGGGVLNRFGSPVIRGCTFQRHHASIGAAIANNSGARPRIENCLFELNAADVAGGCIENNSSSPIIVNCTFNDNDAPRGGAIVNVAGSDATVIGGVFRGNGGGLGGAVYNADFDTMASFMNCVFSGNTATRGGALFNAASVRLSHCTLANNTAELGGGVENGGDISGGPDATFLATNCIFWGNRAGELADEAAQIFTADVATSPVVTFCCVQGLATLAEQEGNISLDPRFVNARGADGTIGTKDDDLHLSTGSPCIDAGDAASIPADVADLDGDGDTSEPTPVDLDGFPRVDPAEGSPDMGAYEHRPG